MAKPPVYPLKGEKGDRDYFDIIVENVANYFDTDSINIDLTGYKETVIEYGDLKFNNAEELLVLSRDFNMWGEYFSNLKSLTEKMYLNAETEKKKEFASASISEDAGKVANGDRLANKNSDVVAIRRKRNELKAFLDSLDSKIDFCYKAHHHCKDVLKWLQGDLNSKILNT